MSESTSRTVPPAGWYPDRGEANVLRWWDGQQWTGDTKSTAPAATAFEQPVSSAAFGFTPVEQNPVASVAAAAVTAAVAPGWYPDNADRTLQRWWDGTQWTTHTAPAATLAYGAMTQPVSSTKNTLATVAMILSIVSFGGLLFAPLLLLALVGLILGIVAVRRVPRFAPPADHRGQAIAGIIVGAVGLVVSILLVVVGVVVYQDAHRTDSSLTSSQRSSPQTGNGDGADASSSVSFPSNLADLKTAIAKSIQRQDSVVVTSVTCDAAASMVAGSTFECGVGVSDGRWAPVRVDIQQPAGSGMGYGLGYGPLLASDATATSPEYTLDQIKQQLTGNLPQAWGSAILGIRCDATASITAGSTFQCTVTLEGDRVGVVMITMVAPGGYDVSVIQPPSDPSSSDPDLANS